MDSFIVTANHVAPEATALVKEKGGTLKSYPVVRRDLLHDICLIKMTDGEYWDYSTASPNVKDKVYSVANPGGFEFSYIEGYVQNVEQTIDGQTFIQIGIDAYFGSSGSAICTSSGQIIGVLVEILPTTRFAMVVPIYHVVALIKRK